MPPLRLGIVADPHVALDVREPAEWHNPFRLDDAHDRLAAAFEHPFVTGADVTIVLGDLVHFGDAESLQCVADAAAATDRPTILLSGNHDVLEPGVRLEDHVASAAVMCPLRIDVPRVRTQFDAAGLAVDLYEVRELRSEWTTHPFVVSRHAVIDDRSRPLLLCSHFPVLSLEQRCHDARLLYSAHLDQLAAPPAELDPQRPTLVLSGHLHVRAVTTTTHTLQLAFAALVEAPYEVARVEIETAPDTISVRYECDTMRPIDADRVPVIDPPTGAFTWRAQGWASEDLTRSARGV